MADYLSEKKDDSKDRIICNNCGASLKFAPGTTSLACNYCGAKNEIVSQNADVIIEEHDFLETLRKGLSVQQERTVATADCTACGAITTMPPNVTSTECAFCATPIVIKGGTLNETCVLQPKSLLPFAIDQKQGQERFKNWISSLWFAPNNLKKAASVSEKLKGMYIPYWTYDSQTYTIYRGERGTNYTVTETYTDSDGKTQTRQVTKIRWTPASGNIDLFFDDVLVLASHSLPYEHAENLAPWDLPDLVPFDEQYITGFQTEIYQVDLESGFTVAKNKMEEKLKVAIKRDIGGDHQRIHHMDVDFQDITFKHILLPIWISAYKYNKKVYRFLINGRTGKVQGERPYSAIKIALAVIAVLAIIFALYYFSQ
ncbi:MAG: hypothetical protein JJT94_13445 [Bernardetiaceae bacterium]|nr:hypothetical protein [Bernardetiaceae bacterium]